MVATPRFGPPWLRSSLQGLAFWVGYRRSIYSAHELSEGALAAELCNLLHAHLPESLRLSCEEPYSKFLPAGVVRKEVGAKARVDLSIWERCLPKNSDRYRQRPRYAIELKRASAAKSLIDQDLRRLAYIVEESQGIRGILCLASEGKRPKRFVTNRGVRSIAEISLPGTNCVYQVIDVRKASHVYDDRNLGQYCCAIEVYQSTESPYD